MGWPWPRDSRIDKLKRIIDSYRTALMEIDPVACKHLDARMIEYGEGWVAGDAIIDVNRMVTAQEVASEFGIQPWNVMDWSRRHPDLIPKHRKGGRVLFRLGDILTYEAVHKKKNQFG